MKLFRIAALVTLFFTGLAAASLQELATAMPPCALKCMMSAIEESDCGTNQTCICTDKTLTANVEACVMLSCTIKQSLTTKNVTQTACRAPVRDRTKTVSITGVVGLAVAAVAFILRIIARFPCCTSPIGSDDDDNAVLDSDFRIRGIHGLRVMNASAFPKNPWLLHRIANLHAE